MVRWSEGQRRSSSLCRSHIFSFFGEGWEVGGGVEWGGSAVLSLLWKPQGDTILGDELSDVL